MRLLQTARGWEVWTPAKVNLLLEVLHKRPDGFHEIETVMAPISLYDTLSVANAPDGQTQFACRDARRHSGTPNSMPLPEGADNIAMRAVEVLREKTGCRKGVSLRLVKRIPLAAGLAGGSSNAAAALVAVNRLWGTGLSTDTLSDLAAQLGSDVPFFLAGQAAMCRGRGEQIEPQTNMPPLHLVVVHPGEGLHTAAVYGRCRPSTQTKPAAPLLTAWRRGALRGIAAAMHNQLQPAAEQLSATIQFWKVQFERCGALGHQMSGSGTSYFGVCRSARHARRLAARLGARGRAAAYVVRTIPCAVQTGSPRT